MRLQVLRTGATDDGVVRSSSAGKIGVDKANRVIRGFVVAERGFFKSEGRGQFTDASLDKIVNLIRAHGPLGVPSYFRHAEYDALGTLLGRVRNPRRDGPFTRADLFIDESAFVAPGGDIGTYILTLARTDPSSFGASLTLDADKELVAPAKASSFRPPPIWSPVSIYSCDVVGDGDSCHHGFLPAQFNAQAANDLLMLDLWMAVNGD